MRNPAKHSPAGQLADLSDVMTPVGKSRMVVFGVVLLGMLTAALNQTAIGTALPRIAADLHGLKDYSWVFTSFMVTSAATLPIFGKLSDTYGRKRFFVVGIILLLIGSILAGTSQNILQLIIYRGIQGVGAGALMSNSMAILGELFPPRELAKWSALNQGVFTFATILGPLVGGLLTDHLSWRWVFYVNVPVGVIALVAAMAAMPSFRSPERQHDVDYLGVAALLLAVSPLLVGFSWAGQRYPWGSGQVVSLFAFSVVMVLVFGFIESRAKEPILPLGLFRNPVFAVSGFAFFMVGLGLFGSVMYLPLFVQAVGGQTATNSGLILMPMQIASFAAGVTGGQLLSRWGRYRALALFSMGVGGVGMFLLSRMTPDTASSTITLNMVVVGLGLGVAMPLFTVIVQNAFPQRMVGVVVSSAAFLRSLGGTIGVAVMGTMVGSRFVSGFAANLAPEAGEAMQKAGTALPTSPQALLDPRTVDALQTSLREAGGADLLQQVLSAMQASLASAVDAAFLLGALALGVAFVACVFLKEIPLRRSNVADE